MGQNQKMLIKSLKTLVLGLAIAPLYLLVIPTPKSIAQEWPPDAVIQSMYAGVAVIHGYRAIPTVYRPVQAGFNTGCGPMASKNAMYCRPDHAIYISVDMVRAAYEYGDAALAFVIGHEYAHAMQNVYNFNRDNSPISELQADCLAGFYMRAVPNLVFDNRDIAEIRGFAYSLGDFSDVWEQHHGTPAQRLIAVTFGMQATNVRDCRL